ncbi:hypothetical protein [Bradyrhizobium sp.]|uniref:hypothetical protein n=1 Tax=Bradyrhizobium sp. TaxID=376 RepID=UPI003C32252B
MTAKAMGLITGDVDARRYPTVFAASMLSTPARHAAMGNRLFIAFNAASRQTALCVAQVIRNFSDLDLAQEGRRC